MTLALAKEMQDDVTGLIRDVRAQEANPSVRLVGVTHTAQRLRPSASAGPSPVRRHPAGMRGLGGEQSSRRLGKPSGSEPSAACSNDPSQGIPPSAPRPTATMPRGELGRKMAVLDARPVKAKKCSFGQAVALCGCTGGSSSDRPAPRSGVARRTSLEPIALQSPPRSIRCARAC